MLHEKNEKPAVMIIGAASFLGFHLSNVLKKGAFEVFLIEDILVQYAFDPMLSSRLKKLKNEVNLIDFSDVSKAVSVIQEFQPDVVLYIPTVLFSHHEATTANKYFSVADFSREMKFFCYLVNYLSSSLKLHMVLTSISNVYPTSLAQVWFHSHERLLSAMKTSHRIQSSIIRLHEVYDEWTSLKMSDRAWYIDDITRIVQKVISSLDSVFVDFGCLECYIPGYLKPWQRQSELSLIQKKYEDLHYSPSQSRNIVMTTYFTGVKNPMHSVGYETNKFRFMREWLLSARKLGLHLVIFHDRISDGFQQRVKNFYPQVEFVKVSSIDGSPNDRRFQIFSNYIISHEEIEYALLTDLRDIRFGHDPFDVIKQIGNFIFVGLDLPFFFSTSSYGFVLNKVKKCYGNEAERESMKLYTLFNAGILGGSRTAILTTLSLINRYLKQSPSTLNCNMPALAIVLHKHLYDQTFSGYPFNNIFGVEYAGSPGVAVMHKTGHRIYP